MSPLQILQGEASVCHERNAPYAGAAVEHCCPPRTECKQSVLKVVKEKPSFVAAAGSVLTVSSQRCGMLPSKEEIMERKIAGSLVEKESGGYRFEHKSTQNERFPSDTCMGTTATNPGAGNIHSLLLGHCEICNCRCGEDAPHMCDERPRKIQKGRACRHFSFHNSWLWN